MVINADQICKPVPSIVCEGRIFRSEAQGKLDFQYTCPYCELSIELPFPFSLGVDDVFVFINTYRQATHLKDVQLRMIHTIQTAGKATFFTSLTTAAAYAANIFSQVCCSLGIWGFLFLPKALKENEAASNIFLPL